MLNLNKVYFRYRFGALLAQIVVTTACDAVGIKTPGLNPAQVSFFQKLLICQYLINTASMENIRNNKFTSV